MAETTQTQDGLPARPLGWLALLFCIAISAAGLLGIAFGADDWLAHRLPAQLLRHGPGRVPIWKWLLLPLLLLSAWSLGYLLSRLSRGIMMRIALRTVNRWDEAALARLGGPLTLAWLLFPTYFLLRWLELRGIPRGLFERLLRVGLLLALFWGVARTMDVLRQALSQSQWAKAHQATQSLLPLAVRIMKVAVWALAVIALLSELGYSVTSLVAGLGIGGLAVALAAQKTVENLFGAFSISADQPFREGDFVKIEDFVGTVESIGLRSTRIRTLDRTIITIPNGKLAEMRLESFAARDRLRLACDVSLVYETTAAQLRQILSEFERVLREQPKIWPDAVVVRFKELGQYSLNIEVMAWFQTSEWSEFQLIREGVLIQFMEVVSKAGSAFARPTRTVHLVADSADESK